MISIINVGDTLRGYPVRNCFNPQIPVVTSIDSILIAGDYRKRWQLDKGQPIIEGIGATEGLLETGCDLISSFDPSLMCFSQNGNTLYSSPPSFFALRCDLINSSSNISPPITATISPNPFHDFATVTTKEEAKELKIYNSAGILIKQWKGETNVITIDRKVLADGLYFFQLTTTDNKFGCGKFIVD